MFHIVLVVVVTVDVVLPASFHNYDGSVASTLINTLVFQVPEYEYPKNTIPDYLSILVPNVDNIRTDFLIDVIAKQGKAVLLIGEQVRSEQIVQTVIVKYFCRHCCYTRPENPLIVIKIRPKTPAEKC